MVDPAGVHLPGLVSAIVISLMTDWRAEPSDALPDGMDDRRGRFNLPDGSTDTVLRATWNPMT